MLEINVQEQGRKATLSSAILLYTQGRSYDHSESPVSYATIHPVTPIQGRPEIAPGRLLTQKDLQLMVQGVSGAKQDAVSQWFEPGMLAKSSDRMIWWTPPTKRPMFFKASSFNEKTFDGNAVCPTPGLVWMAMPGQGLYVFAVKGNERPTKTTPLFQAPFFNVWGRGKVCIGSASLPGESDQWEPQAWEQTFFGSHFTHPNFTEVDRLIKGEEPTKFWQKMIKRPAQRFPDERLVQIPVTAGELLDRLALDKLNSLPTPKGEF